MNPHRQSSTSLPAKAAKFRRPCVVILAGSIAALFGTDASQAANVTFTLTPTTNVWSTDNWSPAINTIAAGDIAQLNNGATATTSLDTVGVTLGQLQTGTTAGSIWNITAGGGSFVLNGTGISSGNAVFGVANIAAIASRNTGGNLSVAPDLSFGVTALDIGATSTGTVTIGGNITATAAQTLNFRGTGSGTVTVNGNIGVSGSNIALSNQRTTGGSVTIAGALGSSVTTVTQNGTTSQLILNNAANAYTGGSTVNNGTLLTTVSGASGTPFGTGNITLNGTGATNSNQTTLSIVPSVTGATALTGGATAGSQFSFSNTAFINIVRKDVSSPLTYTFGSGSGSVLNRVGQGVLIFMDNTSNIPSALGVSGGNNFIVNGAAPTVTNGMVPAYFLGGRNGGSGQGTFLTYDNTLGFKNVAYDLTNTFVGSDNTKKVAFSGTVAVDAAAYAVQITGSTTISPGVTLSIGDNGATPAGLILNNTLSGGTVAFGASEGILYASGSLTMSSVITGTGGVTKTGYNGTNGTLTLTGLNAYTGVTSINSGTLAFNNAGNQSLGGLSGAGIVQNAAGAGQLSFTQAAGTTSSIATITNSTPTGATGEFTLNSGLNSVTTVGTVNGANGSRVTFAGDATGSTTITNLLNTAGQTIRVTAGTVNLGASRNTAANLVVAGGTLNTTGTNRLSMANNDAQTLTVGSGTLNVLSTADFGLRLGGDSGAGLTGFSFTGIQTGGAINALGLTGVTLGSITGSKTASFSQSGGTFTVGSSATPQGFVLGADTAGTSTTTYNLSGGKLVVSGAIAGSQGAGAKQAFVFTGGTLAARTFTATNLTSTAGAPVVLGTTNILNNGGGTVAPGDLDTAGLTTITGGYTGGGTGTLAFDLGGAAVATAFQNAGAFFDQLQVTGATSLNDALSVSLINAFTPTNAMTFKILDSNGTLSGAFTNAAFGGTITTTDGLGQFTVSLGTGGNLNDVILSNFLAIPEPGSAVSLLGGLASLLGLQRFRRRCA